MVILLKCDSVTELLVMIISYILVVYIHSVLRYFINRISTCIIIGYHFGERLQKWVKNSLRQFYISISVVTIIGMHYIVTMLGRLQNEPTVPFTRLTQTTLHPLALHHHHHHHHPPSRSTHFDIVNLPRPRTSWDDEAGTIKYRVPHGA